MDLGRQVADPLQGILEGGLELGNPAFDSRPVPSLVLALPCRVMSGRFAREFVHAASVCLCFHLVVARRSWCLVDEGL